ncbi:LOW QUALITY PROTEIN: hypothetical protein U9M48_027698 [Paspalum notatum var. saurae]|uniref:Reverse transcriptase domain-containing protein n=1 Tax=Paspalum notatum var. saurae TaxID=547442 RepID=A0AAQ3TTE7_PASNO
MILWWLSRRFDAGNNLQSLNSAFITLIPKKDGVVHVKDYHPISLVHSFAKLVTKIFANRLAGRLHELVSPNQSAFIKGRSIQDNFLLVQQTTRFLHLQKQARILLKIDITKAFDSVSWSFLLEVLWKLGFGLIWWNVLSVMDVLSLIFAKASAASLLQPLSTRSLQRRGSLYADDVVIFLRPAASNLSLALDTINVFLIQCAEVDVNVVQNILPCELKDFPSKYLGVPLSLRNMSRDQIQPFIDRIADCLPGWKADLLTWEVLTSMLVYLQMVVDFLPWAIKEVDKIRRRFLWRGRKQLNGGHCLVAWPKSCRPHELGGLGITDLQKLS